MKKLLPNEEKILKKALRSTIDFLIGDDAAAEMLQGACNDDGLKISKKDAKKIIRLAINQ